MVGQLTGGRQNSWERNWEINKRSSQMGDVVKHETDTSPALHKNTTESDVMKGVGKRGLREEDESSNHKWGNCTVEEPFR
jgi:hypothetical protein